jgi:hypothetical protein
MSRYNALFVSGTGDLMSLLVIGEPLVVTIGRSRCRQCYGTAVSTPE